MAVKTDYTGLELAIIGISGRFPGADTVQQLWSNLVEGQESITFFSREELIEAGVGHALLEDPNFVRAKGVMPNLELFDAEFFQYTPRDAALMDPQVRILHEIVFHALEDAGYASAPQRESIGLFLGATNNLTWELETLQTIVEHGGHHMTALQFNDKDFAATRISYSLNLQGPSVSVSTACSTSLYAVDMACRHILTGACSIAVAGGSGLSLPGRNGYLSKDGRINSPDGHCRPFDQDAVGTVEGNGAGMIVLKRLDDAIRDRDRIYAVIRGTACNNDGNRKVSYTAPSVEGQAEVIRRAVAMANIAPESVSYIEAHGTGTMMGDPIEIAGLTKVYSSARKGSIGVGSLKSNIGHLDAGAGVSALIKTALALQHKLIPATLHFQSINPQIDLENTPFYIVSRSQSWERSLLPGSQDEYAPLRAGVSSFGIGGTNVHMILEEAPERERSGPGREWKLLCLSARTESALQQMKGAFADFLDQADAPPDPSDLAWSQQLRQRSLPYRFTLVFREIDDLKRQLAAHLQSGEPSSAQQGKTPAGKSAVYFMFPGHGTQYLGMGQDLYRTERLFRDALDECLRIVEAEGNQDVRRVLLHPEPGDEEKLMEADISQLCLFILEYSLARMLMHWGIQPAGMIGHSLGEYSAACLAGVFTLEEAIRLVTHRGRLMISMPEGAMLSVNTSAEAVMPMLTDELSLAAMNSANKCTVSGTAEAIAALEKQLAEQRIMSIRIQTGHGFHSFLMEGAMEPYAKIVGGVNLQKPQIPYISNVSGDWITASEAMDPGYYARHLRSHVNFAKGIQTILADERALLLEIGPGRTLSALARQADCAEPPARAVNVLRDPGEAVDDAAYLAARLADLWRNGAVIDWTAYYEGQIRNRISLPPYPFEPALFPAGTRDLYQLLRAASPYSVPAAAASEIRHDVQAAPVPAARLPVSKLLWEPAFLPVEADHDSSRACLMLTDEQALAQRIIDHLPEWRCMIAHSGSAYRYGGTLDSVIRQGEASDMRQLLRDLREQALLPDTILVLQSTPDRTGLSLRLLVETLRGEVPKLRPEIVVLSSLASASGAYELLARIRGTRVELPELNIRAVDAGVPIGSKKTAAAWAKVLKHELGARPVRHPAVSYMNDKRCILRFAAWSAKTSEAPLRLEHVVLLTDAGNLARSLALAQQLNESFGARVSVLPYRMPGDLKDQLNLASWSADEERIRILPLTESRQASGLESAIQAALERLPDAEGIVYWDEPDRLGGGSTVAPPVERLTTAGRLNRLVAEAARRRQVPAMAISVLMDASRWSTEATEWIAEHGRWQRDNARVHRIYVPEGECPADQVAEALRQAVLSETSVAAINLDRHPFIALGTTDAPSRKKDLSEDEKLEMSVKSIWENLLGREILDRKANFFELGGDSFKLIQMIVDLNQLGYKVAMNEVYEHPSVASLARHLRGKDQSGEKHISDVEELESKLQEALGHSCRFQSVHGTTEPAMILFVDDALHGDLDAVRRQLRDLQAPYELLPDYIVPLSAAERLPEQFEEEDLVSEGILLDDERESVRSVYEPIDRAQQALNNAILSQPVVNKYNLSHIQKILLRGEMRLQLYSIDFMEMVDEALVERAFCDVIGSHGLLRSCLHKRLGSFTWREYAPPQHTPLPRLDISRLTKTAQQKVIAELVKKEWQADFKMAGIPMFHVVLIKWSEKRYELFFQFDHTLIDLTSGKVMRRHLLKRYQELLHGTRTAMKKSTGYSEFLHQVRRGPIGTDAETLISKLDLHRYYEYKMRLHDVLKPKRGRVQKLDFHIDLPSVRFQHEEDHGYFEIAIQIYSLSLARLLNLDAVPFNLYYVNRTYGGHSFANVVGPAVDSIPFIVPVRRDDPHGIAAWMRERIQWMNKHNVNFSNMEWNLASMWRWRKLLMKKGILGKTIRGQFTFNYSSNVEQEYGQIWDRSLLHLAGEDQNKLDYGDFYSLVELKGTSLHFMVLTKIEPDMERIRRIFEEEAAHLLTFYQGEQ